MGKDVKLYTLIPEKVKNLFFPEITYINSGLNLGRKQIE